MLLDTRKENKEELEKGFNPNVQNAEIPAERTGGQMFLWVFIFCILLGIITLGICPIAVWMTKRNKLNRMQMKTNEATSGIEVQLAQRRDTLVKLVDATKSSIKFEKELLTEVTSLRSMKIDPKNAVAAANQIEGGFGRFMATFEKYPELQSTKTIRELMDAADYQEREIAATRRLYNSVANQFNSEIVTWPTCIIASSKSMKLHSLPLFVATQIQRQDVSFDLSK